MKVQEHTNNLHNSFIAVCNAWTSFSKDPTSPELDTAKTDTILCLNCELGSMNK